jgi:hypothetical protein
LTVSVKGANFHGHEALRIERGGLVATLLPWLGGRLISLLVDGVDLFWHDPRLGGSDAERAALPRPVWWGGWKTWVAPHSRWNHGAPHRDLDEGCWRHEVPTDAATGNWFVRMTSPVDRESGLEIVREISLVPESQAVRTRVTLANRGGAAPVEAGIWEVIQLKKPAQVTIPVDRAFFTDEQGVRTYTTERDSRTARQKHVRTIDDAAGRRAEVRCSGDLRFKFGARTPAKYGRVRAVMPERGRRALKLLFDAPAGARYAHEANVEVYNSDEAPYCEIEAHAPLATLAPGASVDAEFTLEVKGPS